MYRTKHMGYITDNQGMICLVADNMLAVEICFYPHSEYEDQIKKGYCNFLTVVLIDNIKDTVEDIKILRIPKEIKHKLQEQWLLSIEKGLSFADYNVWMFLTNYTQHWSESISKAEAFQKAEEAERLEEEKRKEEASKETTQQPAEEPTVEPTEQPTEEPTHPVEAEPQFTFTDLSATMYAQKNINIRDLPNTDGNKLGGLSTNQEIAVNGQCNKTGWYRFDYNGTTAYVSDKYLGDSQVEIATSTAGSSNPSSSAMSRNAADYRSISSLSELSAGAGWDTDWEGFKTNYKNIEKVAYTHNGITVLLYDYQWDNTVIYYDFTYPNAPWRRTNASYVDAEIEAGGSKYYKYPNGVETEYMDPISSFQVY